MIATAALVVLIFALCELRYTRKPHDHRLKMRGRWVRRVGKMSAPTVAERSHGWPMDGDGRDVE